MSDAFAELALHRPAYAGAERAARVLVAQPQLDINYANAAGDTAIVWAGRPPGDVVDQATGTRRANIVALLARAGAEVDHRGEFGRTALIYASIAGYPAVVTALIEAGADPEVRNDEGSTALIAAAAADRANTIEVLLKAGARRDARDNAGRTAREVARSRGNRTAVAALS